MLLGSTRRNVTSLPTFKSKSIFNSIFNKLYSKSLFTKILNRFFFNFDKFKFPSDSRDNNYLICCLHIIKKRFFFFLYLVPQALTFFFSKTNKTLRTKIKCDNPCFERLRNVSEGLQSYLKVLKGLNNGFSTSHDFSRWMYESICEYFLNFPAKKHIPL